MRRLLWATAARRDINAIWDPIALDSPGSAELVDSSILRAADRLILHPRSGRRGRIAGTREPVAPGGPYILINRVRNDDTVEIARIVHGAMLWPPRRD